MAATTLTAEQKQALALMRQRLGPVPDWLREHHKQLVQTRKAVRDALAQEGQATVPQIAEATGLERRKVFGMLAAMRRFGQVREVGEQDDYPLYALVEPDNVSQ